MLSLIAVRSLLILLSGGAIFAATEILTPNLLQRGATSKNWIWKGSIRAPEILRRRRFLAEEPSEAWWKDMIAPEYDSFRDSLNPSEKPHFIKADYPPPFDNAQVIHDTSPKIKSEEIVSENHHRHPDDIDQSLLHEVIIDEFHRPSKIEFESASQRLREASDIVRNSSPTNSTRLGRILKKHHQKDSLSKVEYVVPGVEHVISHVQYANEDEDEPPPEIETVVPQVSYVVPNVAYVEPEIEYQEEQQQKLDSSERRSRSFADVDITDSYASEKFPEESISIGRRKLPYVKSAASGRRRPIQSQEEESFRSLSHRKLHGAVRNHEGQLPAIESLPVEQFRCDDVSSAGYYADISSKCQVFHICHENGQRSTFLCPTGTLFNQEYLVCDWWYNVECGGSLQNNYAAETLQAFSSNIQKLNALTQSNRFTTDVDSLQEIPYSRKHIEEDTKRSLQKQKFYVSAPNKGFMMKKINLQPIHESHKRIKEDSVKFLSNQQFRVSSPGDGFTTKKINLQPIHYDQEHTKQDPSAEKTAVQTAVNYPDGYTVLLWEHMKNSPIKIHVYSKDAVSSHCTGNDSCLYSDKHATDTNKSNRKSPSETKETRQQNRLPKSTPVKKQRQNKRYFGGLKPFVLTTTKTAKIHSYNYHNDKTLIEILPNNLSDTNLTTSKPSIVINSADVKEIIPKNLLLHKRNFKENSSPNLKNVKSQKASAKDISIDYKNLQGNTIENKSNTNAKSGEIILDFPKFSYIKIGNINGNNNNNNNKNNNNNNNSYFNYYSAASMVKFEKTKSNETDKKYNASKIQHNDHDENKFDSKSKISNKNTTKLLQSTTKIPKITNKIIRNYNRTAAKNGQRTDKELRFFTLINKGIHDPKSSQISQLNISRKYGDRLSFNAKSDIFNKETTQKTIRKQNIALQTKGKKRDKSVKQEKNANENLQNRTNQISYRANKTKMYSHKTSNNKANMQRTENNTIPNFKSERMFQSGIQKNHSFVSHVEESKKEAEKHINKNFTVSIRVQAKELSQLNHTKPFLIPNTVHNIVQNNSIKAHHLTDPYMSENGDTVNPMTNKPLNGSEMLLYRKQNITKIKHKHGGFVVIKKVKAKKMDLKTPLNLTENADAIKPNITGSLELNSSPNDGI